MYNQDKTYIIHNNNEAFYTHFSYYSLQSGVHFTLSTSQLELATFLMLNSHM